MKSDGFRTDELSLPMSQLKVGFWVIIPLKERDHSDLKTGFIAASLTSTGAESRRGPCLTVYRLVGGGWTITKHERTGLLKEKLMNRKETKR